MAGHDAAVRGLLHEYASRRLSGCARAWQSTAPEPPAYWPLCPSSRRPSRSPSRNDGITFVLICIATCAANRLSGAFGGLSLSLARGKGESSKPARAA